MEARRRESLRMKGDGSSREDSETGPRHEGEPPGGQKTEGGDRGTVGGYAAWGGSAECK